MLASFGVLGPGATKLAQAWSTGQRFKTFTEEGTLFGFNVKKHLNKIKSNIDKQKIIPHIKCVFRNIYGKLINPVFDDVIS